MLLHPRDLLLTMYYLPNVRLQTDTAIGRRGKFGEADRHSGCWDCGQGIFRRTKSRVKVDGCVTL
jgi:hypothetical protein